jgi:hypothetical protein
MRELFFTAALLMLAGCTLFESPADRAMRHSPDFRAGYSDGCASASLEGANKRDTNLRRDESAWQNNRAYHSGWSRGFGACRQYQTPQSGSGIKVPGMGGGAAP